MHKKTRKINFYFDKNIWSDIIEMSESDRVDFQNLINPLKEQLKIGIYYSPIGVLELIKGMKLEKHYQKCQDEIRMAARISDQHLLEHPWDHARRSATAFLNQPFKNPDLDFLNLCGKISTLPYNKIEPEIQPICDLLNKWTKEWTDSLNSLKLNFREKLGFEEVNKNSFSQAKEFWEKELILKRKQRLWIAFCDHYSLSPQVKDFSLAFAYDNFHSFRYWVDYRLTYENKVFFESKNPESGDYLDWEQVVYLNIMDYLVTNDKKFRTILKECDNNEMHSVAINFDRFIDCLRGVLPRKRAPNITSERWYDAH